MVDMNKRSLLVMLIAYALLSSCTNTGSDNTDNDIVITNVTIIDAKQGPVKNVTVVVRGDKIISVSSDATPESTTTTANIIDGTGKYLIPGLWDMHVHLTYDDRFTDLMPQSFLSWGVTSVRDTGGMMQDMLPVISRMRAIDAVSPRVYFAGPLLDGQHVVYDGNARPLIGTQNSDVEQARENVRRLKNRWKSSGFDGTSSQYRVRLRIER
jgi:hypothetical protein